MPPYRHPRARLPGARAGSPTNRRRRALRMTRTTRSRRAHLLLAYEPHEWALPWQIQLRRAMLIMRLFGQGYRFCGVPKSTQPHKVDHGLRRPPFGGALCHVHRKRNFGMDVMIAIARGCPSTRKRPGVEISAHACAALTGYAGHRASQGLHSGRRAPCLAFGSPAALPHSKQRIGTSECAGGR